MINVLHLYYDLLNLYGENANTRCLKEELTRSNIKVKVDLKSINDKIDFEKYDIVYIGSGSEENLELALEDILKRKNDLKKYKHKKSPSYKPGQKKWKLKKLFCA